MNIKYVFVGLLACSFASLTTFAMNSDTIESIQKQLKHFPHEEILAIFRPDSEDAEAIAREKLELAKGMLVVEQFIIEADLKAFDKEKWIDVIKHIHTVSSDEINQNNSAAVGKFRSGTLVACTNKQKYASFSFIEPSHLRFIYEDLKQQDEALANKFASWVNKALTADSMEKFGYSEDVWTHMGHMFVNKRFNKNELEGCNAALNIFCLPQHIEEKMGVLADFLVEHVNDPNKSALSIASLALWGVCSIHPFANGNGRVARLMAHGILLNAGMAADPIDKNRNAYIAVCEQAFVCKSPWFIEQFIKSFIAEAPMRIIPKNNYLDDRSVRAFRCCSKATRTLVGSDK